MGKLTHLTREWLLSLWSESSRAHLRSSLPSWLHFIIQQASIIAGKFALN